MLTRRFTAYSLAALLTVTLGVTGCSSSTTSPENQNVGNAQPAVAPVIIDVRTPEEYAEGHLEGSVNFDVEGEEFENQISLLDKNSAYQVYCRSGNRSAYVVGRMQELGFTQVTDLGGVEDASQTTGKPVIS